MRTKKRITAAIFVFIAGIVLSAALPVFLIRADSLPFLRYEVELKDPDLDLVTITGTMHGTLSGETSLAIPDGGFGTGLDPIGFEAYGIDGQPLESERTGDTWVIKNNRKDLSFSYDVVLTVEDRYSPEVRDMLTLIESERFRLIGRDIYLLPLGEVSEGIIIDIDLYPAEMLQSTCASNGRRLIVPASDNLAVTLAVSGDYRYSRSRIDGTELVLAIAGEWSFDDSELFQVVKDIVTYEIDMFGSAPRDKYLFVCDQNPVRGGNRFDLYGVHFGGGMFLLFDRSMDRSQLYDTPMAIVSHEFFHNWNGEAIAPASDSFAWFTEGATVYYSYLVLLRTNIISEGQYLEKRRIIGDRYLDNPYLETVAIGKAGNSDLSDKDMVNLLYDGGFLAAEALDRWIIEHTGRKYCLVDVLKAIYRKNPDGAVIDEEYLISSINVVADTDCTPFVLELIHNAATGALTGRNSGRQDSQKIAGPAA